MRKLMLVAVVGTAFALTACKKEEAPVAEATTEAVADESGAADATDGASEAAPEASESAAM
jgi:hypothetical protein